MGWYVYLVRTSKGYLYCGVTRNVTRRIRQHNGELIGGAKALRGQRPVVLEWASQDLKTRSRAQEAECKIKKLTHEQKEEMLWQDERSSTR